MVLFQLVFSILPTLLEVGLSCRLLALRFGPRYVCATLAMLVGYVGFTVKVANARAAARREMVTHDNERAAMLVDSLQNAATVRTFAGAAHEAARYDRHVRSISRCQLRAARLLAILNFGQAAIFSLGLGAMMAMAARPPLAPWAPMSVGGLTALNVLLGQLIMPFNFIGWTFQEMQQSVVDIRSLLDVMTARPLVADARDDERTPLPERARGRGSALSLERVTFRYPPNDADAAEKPAGGVALHDVSLRIEPGEFVALVGPSGSGKVRAPLARNAPRARALRAVRRDGRRRRARPPPQTTVLQLLSRAYDIRETDSGVVTLDGVDVRRTTRDEMCSRVAVVAQDAALFDESVAYNIAYGALPPPPAPPSPSRLFLRDPEPLDAILAAPRPDVVAAARRAAVHETVLQLPGGRGYDTKVGERGAALSGGERQRVAIARALMRGADALLADEPTSAADAETEAALIASLRRTAAGGGAVVSPATGGGSATLVVVAHRLASVARADRIVVMESGRIAETGTHAELLARRGGLYARLWALQQGETEEEHEEVGVQARGAVDEAASP